MSEYSLLSQILHRQFLSNGEILNFQIERIKNKSNHNNLQNSNNIFISGLARAGTTSILQSLYSTCEFASFRYDYMPFILNPRIAGLYSRYFNNKNSTEKERIHADGLKISKNSPECLDEPYWINTCYRSLDFAKKLTPHEVSKDTLKGFLYLINAYMNIENKKRFLIKNNNSHLRIISLAKLLPKSKFIIVFRAPLAHSISLLRMHKKLSSIQKKDPFVLEYMNLIGHWEFGYGKKPFIYKKEQELIIKSFSPNDLNYWINQWIFTYEWILQVLKKNKITNTKLVCYEDLCEKNKYLHNLFNFLSLDINQNKFQFRLGKSNNEEYTKDLNNEYLEKANETYKKLKLLTEF